MRRKQTKQKYTVKARLDVDRLTKAGTALTLEVFRRGRKFGEIDIGRGSLTWWPRKGRTGKRMSWGRLAEIMDQG